MSEPEPRWRWVFPVWMTLEQTEVYTQLPRSILRELIISRQIRAQGFYSRIHPIKVNRSSVDELLRTAADKGEPICWRINP
jgi:hypothetical protein